MEAQEKAKEIFYTFYGVEDFWSGYLMTKNMGKLCAVIAIENEYNSKRELLFSLRVNKTIENEKVYLSLIDELIKEEQDIKYELEKI